MTDLLTGERPIFLLHRSYQGGEHFGSLAAEVSSAASDAELGAIVNISRHTPGEAAAILESAIDFEIRIADPEFHEHEAFGGDKLSKRRLERAPYLEGTLPTRPSDPIIRAVLDAQKGAGANVLLTPTGAVSSVEAERSLARTMRWVAATRALDPAEPLVVGLTLSRTWLTDPVLREVLLNEIVDSIERNWYLRIRWDALSPRHAQLGDVSVLDGYALVTQVMADEGKVLLLPQTGLTGWLLSGLGAAGFSIGTGGPEQAYTEPVVIRIKGPRRPPIARIFEPALLHTVRVATQADLAAEPDYVGCSCPSCALMRGASDAIDPARWNRDLAARHLIVSLATLQAQLAGRDRRRLVRRVINSAVATANAAMPSLIGEDRPGHLRTWRDLTMP